MNNGEWVKEIPDPSGKIPEDLEDVIIELQPLDSEAFFG